MVSDGEQAALDIIITQIAATIFEDFLCFILLFFPFFIIER